MTAGTACRSSSTGRQHHNPNDEHPDNRQLVLQQTAPGVKPWRSRRPSSPILIGHGKSGLVEIRLQRFIRHGLLIANSRIEPRIGNVNNEIYGNKNQGKNQDASLDDWKVAGDDSVHDPAAHARPSEDGFCQDGPGQ